MYTWGYLKDVILAKLDMTEQEAKNNKFLNRFMMYANECMTQITSTIRPKQATFEFEVITREDWKRLYDEHYKEIVDNWLTSKIPVDDDYSIPGDTDQETWINTHNHNIRKEILRRLSDKVIINEMLRMPEDFIAFNGRSVMFYKVYDPKTAFIGEHPRIDANKKWVKEEINNENLVFGGENKIIPLKLGKYVIEYDARWIQFTEDLPDGELLDIPYDVLDCIPPYVAAQCWKIDDLQRSAIYQNEFELAFARINNSDYRENQTIVNQGGW